ncbi:MAG: aldolase/citrate lyase family protein [Planctomycetia bacterium]|nr:aldolase/citrate lyase family protein [Planctomycetia bacterium]
MTDLKTKSLKSRLRNGETVTGIFITEFRTPNMGVLLDAAGYDFAIFDMEHCSFTNQDLSAMVPGFRGCKCQPMVRVPAVRREFFQSVLDCGITGIVVPVVESPEQVQEAVAMMKYPPLGKRGLSFCCPHTQFQEQDRDSYTSEANDNLLLVTQIETSTALDRLDEILSVPGIDVAFVGNMDLSLSLGKPNNLAEGPIHDAVQHILRVAKSKGIYGGGNFVRPELVEQFYEDGLRFISLDSDVERFGVGLKLGMQTVKLGLNDKKMESIPIKPRVLSATVNSSATAMP